MKELNVFQQKTAENAKKKLEEIEKLKPILEAAIEGKVIKFQDNIRGDSTTNELDFSYRASNYTVVKEKIKVYVMLYMDHSGDFNTYSTTKSVDYNYHSEVIKSYHSGCKLVKEYVEEIEV